MLCLLLSGSTTINDIFKNKRQEETMKCLYTAITRTSKSLKLLLHI